MNLDLAVSSIRRAVEEAETIVGVPVESAMIGVAGSHVRGVNSRGGITVGSRPRDMQREDVRRAIEAARGVTLPEDREVLHVLPQEFSLDAQDNIRDAIGMVGQRLEANVHIVTASGTATQNIVTAVNRAGVRVDDTVLEPFASAEACLTQDERELGACLLDIGGGTTELIAYTGGVVRHTAAIPVGGDHFTNDLAVGLRTPDSRGGKDQARACLRVSRAGDGGSGHRNRKRGRPSAANGFCAHVVGDRRAARAGTADAHSR